MAYSDIRVRLAPKRRLSFKERQDQNKDEHAVSHYDGRLIQGAFLRDNTLCLQFFDDTSIELEDCGQSCCETRWMSTDDDLASLVGSPLTGIEVRDGGDMDGDHELRDADNDVHETQFLIISTDRGSVTLVNHNEHNGYYGGFFLVARLIA